jgi:hypothetical protein
VPKVRTKEALIHDTESEYVLLMKMFNELTSVQKIATDVCAGWSVKDLLAHLVQWKLMFLGWYKEGLSGKTPKTPAEDLKWNQLPALNERIYQKWKKEPLEKILVELENTYQLILELTKSLSEEKLFQKKLYPWMGPSFPLYGWIRGNTSSHYLWARKLIRKWKNSQ